MSVAERRERVRGQLRSPIFSPTISSTGGEVCYWVARWRVWGVASLMEKKPSLVPRLCPLFTMGRGLAYMYALFEIRLENRFLMHHALRSIKNLHILLSILEECKAYWGASAVQYFVRVVHMKHCWDRCAMYNCSWWSFAVRKATSVVKYLTFGVFIIALDRLHQKYGRKRTSSSMSSETSVIQCVHTLYHWRA